VTSSSTLVPLRVDGLGEFALQSGETFGSLLPELARLTATNLRPDSTWFVGSEPISPSQIVGAEPLTFGAQLTQRPIHPGEGGLWGAHIVENQRLAGTEGAAGSALIHDDSVLRIVLGAGLGWSRVLEPGRTIALDQGIQIRTDKQGTSRVRLSWRWHLIQVFRGWTARVLGQISGTYGHAGRVPLVRVTIRAPRTSRAQQPILGQQTILVQQSGRVQQAVRVQHSRANVHVRRVRFMARAWLRGVRLRRGDALDLRPVVPSQSAPNPAGSGRAARDHSGQIATRLEVTAPWTADSLSREPQAPNAQSGHGAQTAVSVIVPLAVSAAMAAALHQPMYLLFGLAGPALILAQYAVRKRSRGENTEQTEHKRHTSLADDNNSNRRVTPAASWEIGLALGAVARAEVTFAEITDALKHTAPVITVLLAPVLPAPVLPDPGLHTTASPHTVAAPHALASPHTVAAPHALASPHTVAAPQTSASLQTGTHYPHPQRVHQGAPEQTLAEIYSRARALTLRALTRIGHASAPNHARSNASSAPIHGTHQEQSAAGIPRVTVIGHLQGLSHWEFLRWLQPTVLTCDDWLNEDIRADAADLVIVDALTAQVPLPRVAQLLRTAVRSGIQVIVLGSAPLAQALCREPDLAQYVAPQAISSEAPTHARDCLSTADADALCALLGAQAVNAQDDSQLPAVASLHSALVTELAGQPLGAKWNTNSPESLMFPLGAGPRGSAQWLDLVSRGPHALVAGTTGSGKSEFLQSIIFALAARYSPAELQLVLVDYKGGAGLGACARLPHSVAMVTDLDPLEAPRALAGLRRELERRERLFQQVGVTNFAQFSRASGSGSLARLLVVVDEFRALADDQPDFVPSLVRLAAQGRSLGIHLVLATQRPAGAITADMRANIPLRVCLRVADETDSIDVLGVPDGAHIPSSRPGRLLARVGAEPLILAQSYLAAERQVARRRVIALSRWHGRLDSGVLISDDSSPHPDPLDWLMAGLGGLPAPQVCALWAPALPEVWSCTTAAALGASPAQTQHVELRHALGSGNAAVLGRTGCGKTTALLALVRGLSNPRVMVTHTEPGREAHAGVVQSEDGAPRVFWIGPASEHQRVRMQLACSGLTELNCVDGADGFAVHGALSLLLERAEAGLNSPGEREHFVLVIDTMEEVRRELEGFNRGSGVDLLDSVMVGGRRMGVTVLSAHSTSIPRGQEAHITTRLVLTTGDRNEDTMWNVPKDLAGTPALPGRAVWLTSTLALICQVAQYQEDLSHEAPSLETQHVSSAEPGLGHTQVFTLPREVSLYDQSQVGTVGFAAHPLTWPARSHFIVVGPEAQARMHLVERMIAQLLGRHGQTTPRTTQQTTEHTMQTTSACIESARNTAVEVLSIDGEVDGPTQLDALHERWLQKRGEDADRSAQHTVVVFQSIDSAASRYPEELKRFLESARRFHIPILASAAQHSVSTAYSGALSTFLFECPAGILLEPSALRDREFLGTAITHAIDPVPHHGQAVVVRYGRAIPARVWTST